MSGALESWSEFNVAMAGASAALAGLVIVAASVNIGKIVQAGSLTARLASAIAALVLALVASAVALVPDVDLLWYGVVILLGTVAAGAFQVHATRMIMRDPLPSHGARIGKSALGFLPIAGYLAAGIALVGDHRSGLPLTAAGCLLAIVSAIAVSWVALVEVLR